MKKLPNELTLKNLVGIVKKNSNKIKDTIIFLVLVFFGVITPILLAFNPLLWAPLGLLSNDSEIKYDIWVGGNQDLSKADFGVSLVISTVDFIETQSTDVYLDIKVPIIVNGSIIDHEWEDTRLVVGKKTYMMYSTIEDFKNYSGEFRYDSGYTAHEFPFDSYVIRFRFFELENISINEQDQIFYQSACLAKEWKILFCDAEFSEYENNNALDVYVLIGRKREGIFTHLAMPLIILGAIFFTMIFANPLDSFSASEEEDYRAIEKRIERNINFRVGTARWIVAFSFANILLGESFLSTITFKTTLSLATLLIACTFYFTSKNQGDNWGIFNFLVAAAAAFICVFILFLALILG